MTLTGLSGVIPSDPALPFFGHPLDAPPHSYTNPVAFDLFPPRMRLLSAGNTKNSLDVSESPEFIADVRNQFAMV